MHRRFFLGIGGSAAATTLLAACVPATETAYGVSYYEPYGDPAFAYHYYPSSNVYYHVTSRYYYYPVAGRWHRSRRLPSHFRLRSGDRRDVQVRDRHPYYRNDEHRRRFDGRGDGDGRSRDDDGRRDRRRRETERRETERRETERREAAGDRRDRSQGGGNRQGEGRRDQRPPGGAGGNATGRDWPGRPERAPERFESPLIGNPPPRPGEPGYDPRTGGPYGDVPYNPRMGG